MDRRDAIKKTALLTGFALSTSTLTAIMQGCQPEQQSALDAWTPQFFTKEEGLALAEIGERILPRTDTPGAQDVFVHEFIDQAAYTCMDAEEQQRFRVGIKQLLDDFQKEAGKPLQESDPGTQLNFLNKVDKSAREWAKANPDAKKEEMPFFLDLKQMVLAGYFSSEKIGTEVTAFLPIPGGYDPCMPYEVGTPVWTL
jgi:hypothetical protein